jgi:hypothetical protein
MKDELLSLLQKIRVFGQALYGPIVKPIIQVFLSQISNARIEFSIKLEDELINKLLVYS